ncbi:auxin canalization protein [Perilla frutescens var. frutescens]|nr:auxin canalization protein [Perilla frutescens var. frutescens]
MTWKLTPFKQVSIKKWVKEIKQRRKEEHRLHKAEVHAAISVAGVTATLDTIAADYTSQHGGRDGNKESVVASAAALVVAQCAKVAEAMGAKREQLSCVIGSAISGSDANDIVTLTTLATTSIRGADALNVRSACKNRLNGSSPVLPLEDSNEVDFNFEKCRSVIAKGADLSTETADGRYSQRSVSVVLTNEGKVLNYSYLCILKPYSLPRPHNKH